MRLADGLVPVSSFRSADGLREFVVFRRPDGFFGYEGARLIADAGYTYWEPAETSGIYETAMEAEHAARAEITRSGRTTPAQDAP